MKALFRIRMNNADTGENSPDPRAKGTPRNGVTLAPSSKDFEPPPNDFIKKPGKLSSIAWDTIVVQMTTNHLLKPL